MSAAGCKNILCNNGSLLLKHAHLLKDSESHLDLRQVTKKYKNIKIQMTNHIKNIFIPCHHLFLQNQTKVTAVSNRFLCDFISLSRQRGGIVAHSSSQVASPH